MGSKKRSGLITTLLAAGSFFLPAKTQAQEAITRLSYNQEFWAQQDRNFRHRDDFRAELEFKLGPISLSGYRGREVWNRNDDSLGTIYTPKIEGGLFTLAESDYFIIKRHGVSLLLEAKITDHLRCQGGFVFSRRASQEIGRQRRFGTTAILDLKRIENGELPPTIAYEEGLHQQSQCGFRNKDNMIFFQYIGKHLTSTDRLTLPWSDNYLKMNGRYNKIGFEATASLFGLRKNAADISIFWNPAGEVGTSFLDFSYDIKLGILYGTTEAPGYYLEPLKRTALIADAKLGVNFWK